MKLSEHVVTLAKDYSLLFEGKVNWTQRQDMVKVWTGVAKQLALLEAVAEAADNKERAQRESKLATAVEWNHKLIVALAALREAGLL